MHCECCLFFNLCTNNQLSIWLLNVQSVCSSTDIFFSCFHPHHIKSSKCSTWSRNLFSLLLNPLLLVSLQQCAASELVKHQWDGWSCAVVLKQLVTMTVMGKWWQGVPPRRCGWIKLVSVWVWCLVCGCGASNRISCLSPSYLAFPSILSILTLLVYSQLHNPLCVGLWWPDSQAKTVHFTRTHTHASVLSTFPFQANNALNWKCLCFLSQYYALWSMPTQHSIT